MKTNLLILLVIFFTGCQTDEEKIYNRIKSYIDNIKVVDTHEHHRATLDNPPENISFFRHMMYLNQDMRSAGWSSHMAPSDNKMTTDEVWDSYEKYYNYGRATSYHAQLIYGYKKYYGFDKLYVTKEDAIDLEKMVYENYTNNYRKWFDSAFHKSNFEIMLLDQIGAHYTLDYDTMYYALVFRINNLVEHIAAVTVNKTITDSNILKIFRSDPIPVNSLDDYIAVIDSAFKIMIAHNAVCIKNAQAYERSIDYDFVTYEEAKKLFAKKDLNSLELKKLEDFTFHWIIKKSIEHDLPIQIHTGYLAWNRRWLENGHPMKLLPLFMQYPEAKFVLFHGGYPWTSDFVALGKNFPNVYLDLVWLPQISRTVAIRTLHEIFDCVPYNKISWGGDVRTIEESAGSLEIAKEVVARVLTERIEKGWLTEEVAYDMAKRLFRENAINLYKLDEKRNITK